MKEKVKNSVCLPDKSWIIAEIKKQLRLKGYYSEKEGWEKEVTLGCNCADCKNQEMESSPIMAFVATKSVRLRLPVMLNYVDPEDDDGEDWYVSVTVVFDKEVADVREMMKKCKLEEDCKYSVSVSNPGSWNCKEEIEKMSKKEQDIVARTIDLEDNDNVEILSVGMGTFTSGLVLTAPGKDSLFWCCYSSEQKYQKNNFYKLKEVLDSYWVHEERWRNNGGWL